MVCEGGVEGRTGLGALTKSFFKPGEGTEGSYEGQWVEQETLMKSLDRVQVERT